MIRYRVDLPDRIHHLVRVTVTIPADLAAGGRLVLPVWTPGSYVVRDYVRHVQWIAARDCDGRDLEVQPDGGTAWRLPDDAIGPVEVTLELYANDLTVRTNHVDDHHALLIPAATFPYVEGGEDRQHQVWIPPSPAGHRVWSLLPQAPDTPGGDTFVADDRDHLVDSAFEVGAFPHIDFEVEGVAHSFVWAAHGGRPDLDRVARDAAAIFDAAVELFDGELPIERYTILAVGWERGEGGLEHRDGAVVQMPVGLFQDDELYARFQSLLAHEYLHLWNVKRLVPAGLTRPAYDRPTRSPSLWVAEGWTAYYDDLLPLRSGTWPVRRVLDVLAGTYQRLRDTPGTAVQSLREASRDAWTKHYVRDENAVNAMTDYYGHGSLVAWELDLHLRDRDPGGDGLDAALRTLWARHGRSAQEYTEDDVLAAVAEVGGDDLAALADQRAGRPGLPELDEVVAAAGLAWRTETGPTPPRLGVKATDDADGVTFTSVLRHQPAWEAGITGGDRLIAIDGRTVGAGQLATVLLAHSSGDTVQVTVTRGPRLLTFGITLAEPTPPLKLVIVDDPTDPQRQAFRRWTGHAIGDS